MSNEKSILVTWDVDGTLILGADEAVQIHQVAFKEACEQLFNQPCNVPEKFLDVSLNGFMDQKIVKLMLEKLGHQPTMELINQVVQIMENRFETECNCIPQIPPGVINVLDKLYAMPNVRIGIVSGNWPGIGHRKLKLAGIDKYFDRDQIIELGYFDERKDALVKAREDGEKLNNGKKFDTCIHVGDTPGDVKAANGANFIAVAVCTGRHQYDYPKPSIVLKDLEEGCEAFMKLLD